MQQALSLHYFKEHKVISIQDIKALETRNNHSITVSGSRSGKNIVVDSRKSRIACYVCGRYFYNTASLKMHSVRSHGRKVPTMQDVPAAGEIGQ